jgi:DNA-binding transcriptional ArsR family regulator
MARRPIYDIDDLRSLRALAAPTRQEVVDTVNALGVCSIRQIAASLGCPADGLYYHLRALLAAGLLVSAGTRPTRRRAEQLVATPTRGIMRIRYRPADRRNAAAMRRIVASMLRVAERDFVAGFDPRLARCDGPERNLSASRQKAWLDRSQRREVIRLLMRLQRVLADSRPAPGAELHSLTMVLAPIEPGVAEPGSTRRKRIARRRR